ncbi:RsbRD_N domain-containing protein [Desulfovibrionales bacterium]
MPMSLMELLREQNDVIVQRWTDAIFKTYPLETVGFMRKQQDKFCNPVAYRTILAVKQIVNELVADVADDKPNETTQPYNSLVGINMAIDDLIRIRAVQNFTPAGAVGVFFLLKSILRELLDKTSTLEVLVQDFLQFETKIDSLVLLAFNCFTHCREELATMRIEEIKRQHHSLLRLAQKHGTVQAEDPETKK